MVLIVQNTYHIAKQVPMGACSSSTNILGWAVAQRRCLNDSTIPVKATTLDPKLAAKGCQINLHCHFTRALFFLQTRLAQQWRKVNHYKTLKKNELTNGLISISSHAVWEFFMLQTKNAVDRAMDQCMLTS